MVSGLNQHTPDHWKRLSIIPDGRGKWTLEFYYTKSPVDRGLLELVGLEDAAVKSIPKAKAIEIGEAIERYIATGEAAAPKAAKKAKPAKTPSNPAQKSERNMLL